MPFGVIYNILQKYLDALDTKSVKTRETPKYRSGIAVEEIQIGKIKNNIVASLTAHFYRDFFQQNRVVAEHFAINTQDCDTSPLISNLCDLRWHFESLDAENTQKATLNFAWNEFLCYQKYTDKYKARRNSKGEIDVFAKEDDCENEAD